MDYFVIMAVLGVAVMGAAVLPDVLRGRPLSVPILAVVVGMALFSLPVGLDGPQPGSDGEIVERLTELAVIVSLTGAGLKLRRPVGWRSWMTTWRLLAITMPLTVVIIAVLGVTVVGLPLAAAVLLGGVLAPTDPVLASDVQLAGPGDDRHGDDGAARADSDDGAVRFALTSEAGLNDGLAFPITNLAIAMAVGGNWFVGWFVHDVIVKLSMGVICGVVLGLAISRLTFRRRSSLALARSGEPLVAFGITLTVYGITEVLHGYGFLAVFVAAVTLRRRESSHEYHATLHDFSDALERIASLLFLLLLGGAAIDGALDALSVPNALVALAIVLVVRPAAGWIGLIGDAPSSTSRATIAFFGIRGMGTVYYLAHAVNEEYFPAAQDVWAIAIFTILVSIAVHGVTAGPILHRLERRDRAGRPQRFVRKML